MAHRPQGDADRAKDADRLRDLERRLAERSGPVGGGGASDKFRHAEKAWRMVIELVAGIGLGAGIGYGLDWLFGTRPFLLIIFIFFGFAAGIKTMMRTAAEMTTQPDGAGGQQQARKGGADEQG